MTPQEIRASALDSNRIGSSGLPGVHAKWSSVILQDRTFTRFCCSFPRTPRSRHIRTGTIA